MKGQEQIISPFQEKCVAAIRQGLNEIAGLDEIAWRVKSNRLAVNSALRSLAKKGLADYIPSSRDQWAIQKWFLCGELRRKAEK